MNSITAAEGLGNRPARPAGNAETRSSRKNRFGRVTVSLSVVLSGICLFLFWQVRNEGHLTPESGIGYVLGIAGASAMLLLLVYPLRKRVRFMRGWGTVAGWFQLHMVLGLIGPALILLHSNFKFGSLNSSVALASMLLVAGSGIVGRVIYKRIHMGLYGVRTSLEELRGIVEEGTRESSAALHACPVVRTRLIAIADKFLAPQTRLSSTGRRILFVAPRMFWHRIRLLLTLHFGLRREAREQGWTEERRQAEWENAREFVLQFLAAVRKTVQFSFFERLFATWHVLHIPLFFMLLLATLVHVVAVHMY